MLTNLTSNKICHFSTFLVGMDFIKDDFGRTTFVYTLLKHVLPICFMCDKSEARKGQNEVVSFINYYSENILDKDAKTLPIFR